MSDATKKQQKAAWWKKFRASELLWCDSCYRVYEAGAVRLYDESPGDMIIACPYCDSSTFFEWNDWPRHAVRNWSKKPILGEQYHLKNRWG